MARAWLALDAADAALLAVALERASHTLARVGDAGLTESFAAWCDGVLRPRFGAATPPLANMMETPAMLAETLREWEERLISEGQRTGREEGRRTGREEGRRAERALLLNIIERRFDAATAEALAGVLAAAGDESESPASAP